MIIDLSMTPQFTIRLIVTRDRSFFKLATLEFPMRCRLHRARGSVRRASGFVLTGKPKAILDTCRPSAVAMKSASLNSAAS
jgi:hypothetical protein